MGSTPKFYLDEHVSKAVVKGLRERGMDVRTVKESGLLGATDEEHLRRALEEGRVLVTQDNDFLKLHRSGVAHAGIVYVTRRVSVGEIIRGLALIHEILDANELIGTVEFL